MRGVKIRGMMDMLVTGDDQNFIRIPITIRTNRRVKPILARTLAFQNSRSRLKAKD